MLGFKYGWQWVDGHLLCTQLAHTHTHTLSLSLSLFYSLSLSLSLSFSLSLSLSLSHSLSLSLSLFLLFLSLSLSLSLSLFFLSLTHTLWSSVKVSNAFSTFPFSIILQIAFLLPLCISVSGQRTCFSSAARSSRLCPFLKSTGNYRTDRLNIHALSSLTTALSLVVHNSCNCICVCSESLYSWTRR